MVLFCCVKSCKQERYPVCGLSFHRIPKDSVMAEQWKKYISDMVTKAAVVCNKHFKDEDFINESEYATKNLCKGGHSKNNG